MPTRIGRFLTHTPNEITADQQAAEEPGVAGPFTELAYRVRAKLYGSNPQDQADLLEKDLAREKYVHVEDLDSLIPKGWYRLKPGYTKPGGAPKHRPTQLVLVQKARPQVRVEAEDVNHDVRHIGSTADGTASERKRLAYTPDATERIVQRIGSSLVLLLRLEANANDFSGLGNNGTATGAPTFVAGKVGNGVDLNGTTQYITVTDHATLDLKGALTFEAWVKPDTVSAGARSILRKASAYAVVQSGTDLQFKTWSGTTERTSTATGVLAAATWAHVVCTYDGAYHRIYVDGVLKKEEAFTGDVDTNANNVFIGANAGASEFYDGVLDEVRLGDRAVITEEAKKRYDLTTGGSRPASDYRAPLDPALDMPEGTYRVRLRAKPSTTATARARARWIDKDGAQIAGAQGSQVTLTPADAWKVFDLGGSFVLPNANDKANVLHILIDDPTNVNSVGLDYVEVVPA